MESFEKSHHAEATEMLLDVSYWLSLTRVGRY